MKSFVVLGFLFGFQANAITTYNCQGEGGLLSVQISKNKIVKVAGNEGQFVDWNSAPFVFPNGESSNFFYMEESPYADGRVIYTLYFKDETILSAEASWTSRDHDAGGELAAPVCVKK